jgi:hypothetical protein
VRSPLAVSSSAVLLVAIGILSLVVLALIVVAPWKRVRDEPPLDKDVETRVLLGRPDPEEATGEIPTARVSDLADHLERDGTAADLGELRDLDE